jgi:hypothetical protein
MGCMSRCVVPRWRSGRLPMGDLRLRNRFWWRKNQCGILGGRGRGWGGRLTWLMKARKRNEFTHLYH